jgi:hypothetical protein
MRALTAAISSRRGAIARDAGIKGRLNVSRKSLPELDSAKGHHQVPVSMCPGACSYRSACLFHKPSKGTYCAK